MRASVKILVFLFIVWAVSKALMEGRQSYKDKAVAEMKDNYSSREVFDLVYQNRIQVMFLFLIYGAIAGALLASL